MRPARSAIVAFLCAAFVAGLAACGGSDDDAAPAAASTPADAGSGVPEELLGTWAVTLTDRDLPAQMPPELADGGREWQLVIADTGGPNGGAVLSIVSVAEGELESPALEVVGDHLLLKDEECAAGGEAAFYDNEYTYQLEGDTLTISTESNDCADRVAETILTSRPWTKVER